MKRGATIMGWAAACALWTLSGCSAHDAATGSKDKGSTSPATDVHMARESAEEPMPASHAAPQHDSPPGMEEPTPPPQNEPAAVVAEAQQAETEAQEQDSSSSTQAPKSGSGKKQRARPPQVRERRIRGRARIMGSGRGGGGLGNLSVQGDAASVIGQAAGGGGGSAYGRGGYGVRGAPLAQARIAPPPVDREGYKHTPEASYVDVSDQPLSTFSVDVDTASYSNLRRILREGRLPPADAVRVEEMLNYFDYDYGSPRGDSPFAVHTEVSDCPWNAAHRLVHVGLQTQAIQTENTPPRNLVFLLDVSGSMRAYDKLPLLKQGMAMLARTLRKQDKLSIVVYAGASGLALPPTRGDQTGRILQALESLQAGGSTAGAAGIQQAYRVARGEFVKGGINRVILATDGDFNVGVSSEGELARLIEQKRKSGIFLTVLGFGRGNLQDARMETLADKGNGNYAYIDTAAEARKVLVREAGSTLVTVAKDVKLQVEFNPAHVQSYRLIGYENRTLKARDFNDDKKDAGEVGAGHSVTALYEVVPAGVPSPNAQGVDPLRYQQPRDLAPAAGNGELMTLKVRYKPPQGDRSRLLRYPIRDQHHALASTSTDFRFAAAVAGFGLKLRGSEHVRELSVDALLQLASDALGRDPHGDRAGLIGLIERARSLGLDG